MRRDDKKSGKLEIERAENEEIIRNDHLIEKGSPFMVPLLIFLNFYDAFV